MDNRDEEAGIQSEGLRPLGYEPPKVEKTLTPAELEREVLYAGDQTIGI